jgi:glycosyltransferase involved in cell wall biosynthesis
MEGEVSRNLLCPCGKIAVIPNGFKAISGSGTGTGASEAAFDRQKYAREGESIILYVGRLVYEKGPHLIMEAAQRLRRDDLKFIMVGEGPMRTFLRDLAAKLGVTDRVSLLGHVPDSLLSSLYKNAAVAVFPSLYERSAIVGTRGDGIPARQSSHPTRGALGESSP